MSKYDRFEVKDYKYWTVYVHENQSYLGRCVVWCKRQEAEDLTEATKEELLEAHMILKDLRGAILKAFEPDWMNYAFLGNDAALALPRHSSL